MEITVLDWLDQTADRIPVKPHLRMKTAVFLSANCAGRHRKSEVRFWIM